MKKQPMSKGILQLLYSYLHFYRYKNIPKKIGKCNQCGKCCVTRDGPCFFLKKENRCAIYPIRPSRCRVGPVKPGEGCGVHRN